MLFFNKAGIAIHAGAGSVVSKSNLTPLLLDDRCSYMYAYKNCISEKWHLNFGFSQRIYSVLLLAMNVLFTGGSENIARI